MQRSPRPRSDLSTTVERLARTLAEPPPFGEQHQRVLREAMLLIAEHGYAGASLRALAKRLRMSQPSLYHYFGSKRELAEQILQLYTMRATHIDPGDLPQSPTLAQGLRLGLQRITDNYRDPEHVVFVRFLIVIGVERPELRDTARRVFLERSLVVLRQFVELYVDTGEVTRQDAAFVVDLVVNAHSMRFLRGQLLFGEAGRPREDERFADFIVDTVVRGSRARARAQRAGRST